jgi:hypothetical protein
MTKRFAFLAPTALLVFAALGVVPAQSAPQVLALVNSDGEVALQCSDGECIATLSAFCLQKLRSMPATGTAYEFADRAQVRLVGTRADGSRVVLEASNDLSLSSLRRQVAVRISLPKARLDALGVTSATIEIGRNVTLLPKAYAGDANPLSESEIVQATGPLRRLATDVVARDPGRIGAARWVLRLGDALPPSRALAPKARGAFLARARSVDASRQLSPAARDWGREILNVCQVHTELGAYQTLRQCFEQQHDTLLGRLNVDYWLAVNYGS